MEPAVKTSSNGLGLPWIGCTSNMAVYQVLRLTGLAVSGHVSMSYGTAYSSEGTCYKGFEWMVC